MFIWQKIKARWIAYQERRRAWWCAPIRIAIDDIHRNILQRVGGSQDQIRKLEAVVDEDFTEMRRSLNARIIEVEEQILDKLKEHRHHLGTLDNNVGQDLKNLTEQVNGIRSRYQWVEDRYNDIAKGKVPREFDYEHRQ